MPSPNDVSDRDARFKQPSERCKLLTRWAFEYFDQTSSIFGHVEFEAWDVRLRPFDRHLPPRMSVENRAFRCRQ